MLPILISAIYVRSKGISRAKLEKKHERFKRFRLKSCRSINLPVKNMASGAPRGHITTGIFSTDKVVMYQVVAGVLQKSGFSGGVSENSWK